jgi:hypothetical protein
MDVVVDAGRLNHRSTQLPLLQRSDVVVGVVRADPTSVVHMRQRLSLLHETFAAMGAEAPRLALACVEDVQHQTEAAAAIETIAADVPDVLDLGQVALDAKAVRMFHGEPVFRPERSMLVRSGRTLVERLLAAAGPTLAAPDATGATLAAPDVETADGMPSADSPPVASPEGEGRASQNGASSPADGIPDQDLSGDELTEDALRRPRRTRRKLFR